MAARRRGPLGHRHRARPGARGDHRAQRRRARRAAAAHRRTAPRPRRSPACRAPDAIFVGGGIAEPGCCRRLWAALRPGGRLVANVVSTEGEARLLDWQARHGGALTRIAVSRAEPVGAHHRWRPLAPVTQLAAVKPDADA